MATGKKPFTFIIAEKPSVARDIGNWLAQQQKPGGKIESDKAGGYWLPNGDFISYTVGHLVEMEMPDAYLTPEQNKADPLTYLPLLPAEYKYHPRFKRKEDGSVAMRDGKPVIDPLFHTVEKMIKKADIIINAGDMGREGQLIMDEVFVLCGVDPASPHIKRVAILDMNPKGIAEGFAKIGLNAEPKWINKGMAGRCRQEADWGVGMNASRAYWSVTGSKYVALGRVKTPVLNLVDERCRAIESFKPLDYYVPIITLKDGLEMRWKCRPGAEGTPGFDQEGRIISKLVADKIVADINAGLQGTVTRAKSENRSKAPPKPFSLATLQSEASKRLGVPIEDVTKAAQTLYEKHKMITYVGTECQYLPESMLKEARSIMANLSPMFRKVMEGANANMKPASFSDKKIAELNEEHHAIAPTGVLNNSALSEVEKGVFEMISRRFAAQFYPDYEYKSFGLDMDFSNDQFAATGQETTRVGWKEAEGLVDVDGEDSGVEGVAEKDTLVEEETDLEKE